MLTLPDGRTFDGMVMTGTEGCYFDGQGNLLFVRKIRRVIGKKKPSNHAFLGIKADDVYRGHQFSQGGTLPSVQLKPPPSKGLRVKDMEILMKIIEWLFDEPRIINTFRCCNDLIEVIEYSDGHHENRIYPLWPYQRAYFRWMGEMFKISDRMCSRYESVPPKEQVEGLRMPLRRGG